MPHRCPRDWCLPQERSSAAILTCTPGRVPVLPCRFPPDRIHARAATARHGTYHKASGSPARGSAVMPEFAHTELLPLGPDTTEYRLLTADGITTGQAFGREFIEVAPELL